ncbi:hypothetical protein ACC685_36950, partial [Rhizobium ruizarguesonis]
RRPTSTGVDVHEIFYDAGRHYIVMQNQEIEIRVSVNEGLPDDPAPFNDGAVGRERIYNLLHKADTSFSERSAGFTWFLSFLIKFDRVKK